MGSIFSLNGKFFYYGSKIANLMLVMLYTIIAGLPVFTIGAAVSAMHTMLQKIESNSESAVTSEFFHAFCANFRQGTLLWLLYLLVTLVLSVDFYCHFQNILIGHILFFLLLCLITVPFVMSFAWIFVLVSVSEDPVKKIIRNSFLLSGAFPFSTFLMIALSLLPASLIFFPKISILMIPLGIPVAGLLQVKVYRRVLSRLKA